MAENPFLPKRRRKLAQPTTEEYSPEEQNNILRSVGSSALSGMGYVGDYIDKQVGARAIRGLLGGKPRELLSIIPGSDTFGLTNKSESVSGKELLKWNDPNSWADDIAGFGLEAVLDPSLLIGGGVVRGGGAALKAAGLAGKTTKAVRGVARSARIADEVAKGTRLSKAARIAREAFPEASTGLWKQLTGKTPKDVKYIGDLEARLTGTPRQVLEQSAKYDTGVLRHGTGTHPDLPGVTGLQSDLDSFVRAAKSKGLNAANVLDEPIQSSIAKIGLPGMDPWFEIGKGISPRALKVASGIDKAASALRYNAPMRLLAQNFDAKSMGMDTGFGQRMAKDVFQALPEARQQALRDSNISMLEMGERRLLDAQSSRKLQRQAEGWEPTNADTASIINRERQGIESAFQRAQRTGAAGERLADPLMPQYFPRELANPKFSRAFRKAVDSALLSKTAPTDKKRIDFLKKIVGGTDALEEQLLRHASIVGPGKAPDLKGTIAQLEALKPTLIPLHTDKEIKQLAKFLRRLPDAVVSEGFYKNPIEAAQSYKVRLSEKTVKAEKALEHLNEQLTNKAIDGGVPLQQILKSLKIRRGGMSPSMLKGLATEIKNGTKTTADLVRELERLDKGAFARISEMRGYHNPVPAMIQQLRAGTISEHKAVKEVAKWHKNLNKLNVSKEMANEFTRVNEFFKGPKAAGKMLKILDSYLNLFKAGVLTWPARYVRDLGSGQMQNVLIGEFSPKMLRLSRDVLNGKMLGADEALQFPIVKEMLAKEGLPETAENANRMLRAHLASMELVGERVSDVSQIGGPKAVQGVQQLHQQIPGVQSLSLKAAAGKLSKSNPNWKPKNWSIRGVGKAEETKMPVLEVGNVTGTYIDALNRLPAYLNQLKRGVDPAAAKAKVMSAHVDYSNKALTQLEQKYMTRLAPFYRYSRHMASHTFDELLKNPSGRLAQTVRGSARMQRNSDDNAIVPEHIGRTLSIPIPKNALTEATGLAGPEGHTRYLTGLGMMHEDPLSLFQPGSNAYHTARSTGQSLIGRMNPLAKGLMEVAFGKQAFSGRQLEDLDPNIGRIAANLTGSDQPYHTPILMEQAIANSPLSRAVSSLRTLTDTRPNATSKALTNLFTGARISDVDNEKTMNLARRKLLEELLRGSPGVHRYEHLFAPDDTKLSERERQLMALYRQLSRQSAKEARERKKAG